MQSYHFSFCFNEIRSLIHWSLSTFFIQLEYPNFSHYGLFPLLLQHRSDLPVQVRHAEESALQSTQFSTKTRGICHRCAIFPKWFCTHHAWVGELSATCPWLERTFVAVQKLHVWHHGVVLFDDVTGIDKASKFFLSNFVELCEGVRHLQHEQYTMPISQYTLQSGHCFLEEVSQSSKISVLPMSVINFFDSSLNLLILSILCKSCSEVHLVFYCQRCRYVFPRNLPIRFGGLRIFLLLAQVDLVVHFANSASI